MPRTPRIPYDRNRARARKGVRIVIPLPNVLP
jgi:hypothetical protein